MAESKSTKSVAAGVEGSDSESATVTSGRVPRGPGEPASDALAEHEGVAALQKAVKEQVEKISAQGFRGSQSDTTPNENYTLQGVGRGLPTPETVIVTPKG